MKYFLKLFTFILTFIILSITLNVYAHNAILDVDYDECESLFGEDGEGETWYILNREYQNGEIECRHIPNDMMTIKYWVYESSPEDSTYTWASFDANDESIGEDIKNAYINSMLRWNNVYYYTYNNGQKVANKVINIIEGTQEDHNISIYPVENNSFVNNEKVTYNALTGVASVPIEIEGENEPIKHNHYDKWYMYVNLYNFYNNTNTFNQKVEKTRISTGMHEMGHVLGLRDVDAICYPELPHHQELLMGYNNITFRSTTATYKDIAGVAITRGFHTDEDHVWMKRCNPDNTIDLICAQCNGIKENVTMDSNNVTYQGKIVNTYGDCVHYGKSNSNMLLVATDGVRDFFKCQNCRHIDTVEISEEYILNNNFSTINESIDLNNGESVYYKITSTNNKKYEFILDGSTQLDLKIFDKNFNEINTMDGASSENNEYIISNLIPDVYYLKVSNNSSIINQVIMKIRVSEFEQISNKINNILTSYNNNINTYIYTNTSEKGLYNITLNASTSSGEISYPSDGIKIYKDFPNQELMTRLETVYYSLEAKTSNDSNNLIVFLQQDQTIYIDINLPNNIYSSLVLKVEKIENTYEIDMFNYEEDIYEEEVVLFNDIYNYGDYIQKIEIKQDGNYNISFVHNGPQCEGNLSYQENPQYLYYVFYKEIKGPQEDEGNLELMLPHITITAGESISFEYFLEQGIYYIGYYNKLSYEPMTISIGYIIEDFDTNKIISDPDYFTDCGSMINIYEKDVMQKSFRGSTIVVGFTRILYLDPILEIETRTDYKWYSSNENIATISQFGTIFAKSTGTVKIMAVNKNNPEIVYVKTFDVINDTSTDNIERISIINDTHNSNESIYTIGLTILNSPYPSYYLYEWQIVSYDNTITNIEILGHGKIHIEGFGNVIIKGSNYYYNNKYSVQINLIVN